MQTQLNEHQSMTRRAMRQAIGTQPVTRSEIRYFVDLYYQLQGYRMSGANQEHAANQSEEPPGEFAKSVQRVLSGTEKDIERYLDELTKKTAIGTWANSIVGVGPIISAALIAHIDITQAPTVGHIWRFAGLDPTQQWLGSAKAKAAVDAQVDSGVPLDVLITLMASEIGTRRETLLRLATSSRDSEPIALTKASITKACARRPWNAALKVVCWKLGESFMKTCNHPQGFYGQVYQARKLSEEAKNARGDFRDKAAAALAAKRYDKKTEAYKAYAEGRLPPAHIHARAKRYAVKLFLSAWHEVAWFAQYGVLPPKPYVIDRLGHADLIIPPNARLVPGLAEAHGCSHALGEHH